MGFSLEGRFLAMDISDFVITFPVHHAGKSPPQIIIGRFALLVCLDYASVTRKSRLLFPKTLKPALLNRNYLNIQ